ncbi:MAG: menaquinone biosynthesis protein [Candidatus Omnitrophica bacterium]|nr:menaquinone biosynthesis protein [Candidatus Omnitrophota bacterium]
MNRASRSIRLGYVEYVNAFPFYHNLKQRLGSEEAEFVYGTPSMINQFIRQGKVDAALISSLEYALAGENYFVLSGGCIGAKGVTGSVVLFSKLRMEELDGKRIALSSESLSSACLLKILLQLERGYSNDYIEHLAHLPEMLEQADASLAIGDQALYWRKSPSLFRHDVCDEWTKWQKLPFCFALWVVRRPFAEQFPDKTRLLSQALENNLEENLRDLNALFRNMPRCGDHPVHRRQILDYWQRLLYRMDPEVLKGLERFYELARQMKFLDREIVLEYASAVEVG